MIKITSNKIRWALSFSFAFLILFGTYRNVFSLAAFLGCCLMIFFCEKETILLQLFFVMPMANIFKLSPGVQSFFTILLLLYVVLHLVLPRKATTFIILFGVYVVMSELFAGEFNLFRTIKLICNILFLSSILNDEVEIRHKEIFLSYIIGNVVSSFFGTMDSSVFKIESYIGIEELGNPNLGNDITRFTGLYTDPNYYAVGLIISLCLIVILLHRKEINRVAAVLFVVPIVYFLIQTYSKSAIIMLFVPFAFFIYSLYRRRSYLSALFLIAAAAAVVILALSGRIPALEIVLSRLSAAETDSGVDVNALTTGRFDLWMMYLKHLISNIKVSLLGSGIGSGYLNGRAAHNAYFDVFYFLGFIGGVLLVLSLVSISAQSRRAVFRRNIMNYSVMLCVVVMYFFLSELFYFDPPFHIFLAFEVLNLPIDRINVKNQNGELL